MTVSDGLAYVADNEGGLWILKFTSSVQFASDSSTIFEKRSPVRIMVSLSAEPTTGTVSVNYAATGGSATGGGVDYTLTSGTLTFAPGETIKAIEVAIHDDFIFEWEETIKITLSSPVNANLGTPATHTVTIYDKPLPVPEWNVEAAGHIGGSCNAVAIEGHYAYVGEGASLRIFDISNPAAPMPMGKILLPDSIQDIVTTGGLAYIADWDIGGLRILDISDPLHPSEKGFFITSGRALDVQVSGGLAYVVDGPGGLTIIDVSDPSHPCEKGLLGDAGLLARCCGLRRTGIYRGFFWRTDH